MKTKICTKCGIEKKSTIKNFSRQKKGKYGYASCCKPCIAIYSKQYMSNPDNKKRVKEYSEKWRKENPEYKKKWRKENPEKEKAIRARAYLNSEQWREDNKEKLKEDKLKYRIKNKDKAKLKVPFYSKKARTELQDHYVISQITRRSNLKSKDVRKHPELIEAKRLLIKTKRLCKTSQNSEKA